MCYLIVSRARFRKLIGSANNLLSLLNDGTLAEAFSRDPEGNSPVIATAAFDVLAHNVFSICDEQRDVSPFLRYRREIFDGSEVAAELRALVLNLAGGAPVNLGHLLMRTDSHHARIALEMIAGFAHAGGSDHQFAALASEIRDMTGAEVSTCQL